MSEEDHSHDSPIKTPKQLILVIALSFIVPIALIVLLVQYVTSLQHGDQQGAATAESTVADRIKPVAAVTLKNPNAPKVYLTGEALFTQVCAACHAAGVAGAPKVGDKTAWAPRLGQGLEGLFASVLKGKGAMPPRAGTLPDDVSDYELHRAIVYMANASGGNLKEPPAPAPTTVAATGAASDAAATTAPAPAPPAPAPPAAAPTAK